MFRNFDDAFLNLLKPHLERLCVNSQVSKCIVVVVDDDDDYDDAVAVVAVAVAVAAAAVAVTVVAVDVAVAVAVVAAVAVAVAVAVVMKSTARRVLLDHIMIELTNSVQCVLILHLLVSSGKLPKMWSGDHCSSCQRMQTLVLREGQLNLLLLSP